MPLVIVPFNNFVLICYSVDRNKEGIEELKKKNASIDNIIKELEEKSCLTDEDCSKLRADVEMIKMNHSLLKREQSDFSEDSKYRSCACTCHHRYMCTFIFPLSKKEPNSLWLHIPKTAPFSVIIFDVNNLLSCP